MSQIYDNQDGATNVAQVEVEQGPAVIRGQRDEDERGTAATVAADQDNELETVSVAPEEETAGGAAGGQQTQLPIGDVISSFPQSMWNLFMDSVFEIYVGLLEAADDLVISSAVICRFVTQFLQTNFPGYGIEAEGVLLLQVEAEDLLMTLFEDYDERVGIAEAARRLGIEDKSKQNKEDGK